MPWFLRMHLLFFPFILLVQIYITASLYLSVKKLFPAWQKLTKISFAASVLSLNLFPIFLLILKIFNGYSRLFIFQNSLHFLDYILLFPYWWGLITAVEILPYFIEIDLLLLLAVVIRWRRRELWHSIFPWVKITIIVIFMLYTIFRIYIDTYQVRITNHTVQIKDLPASLQDVKITLIGDIQVDRYTHSNKLKKLEQRINQVNSELLFFTGDLVTSGQHFIQQGLEFLCQQTPTAWRFACMGDHDYWSNSKKIPAGLKNCGWNFLENNHQLIEYRGQRILITGITHIYSQQIEAGHLASILQNAPQAELKILLVHQPAPFIVSTAEKYGYHLILGGHTHGGQIQFRPMGFTVTPSMFETPYYSGLFHTGNSYVVVTNGVGLTLAPVRYRASAEINVITLTAH